jgi:hypothetical protein
MSLFLVIPMISRPAKLASCRSFLRPICMPENSGGVLLKSVRQKIGNLCEHLQRVLDGDGSSGVAWQEPGFSKVDVEFTRH